MSDVKQWTHDQAAAINERDKSILVSAAAGSGKTATLTERIIQRLTDPVDAVDVSELLVATFTEAAAAELRDRIRARIMKSLADDPGQVHLQKQLRLLDTAQISTIDSFCYSLIRANFQALGLSGKIRTGDDTEIKLLEQQVMDETISDCYANVTQDVKDQFENFDWFCRHFYNGKNDVMLMESLLTLYHDVMNLEQGVMWISNLAAQARTQMQKQIPFFQTPLGKRYMANDAQRFSYYALQFSRAADKISLLPGFVKGYFQYYTDLASDMQHLADACKREAYEELPALLTLAQSRKSGRKAPRATETEWTTFAKSLTKSLKEDLKNAISVYAVPVETTEKITAHMAWFLETLYRFLNVFDRRFQAQKRERNIISYNDMERYALQLLRDGKTGETTPIAREVRNRYREIYIDEYQDVNPLQDLIFSSISKEDNLFLVGDVKQSIYAFRGSTPEMFVSYRNRYEQSDGAHKAIFLSENFRCDKHIIDYANTVFSKLFLLGDATPYEEKDHLKFAKAQEGTSTQQTVELHVFQAGKKNEEEDTETDDGEALDTSVTAEAAWVAEKIKSLLETGKRRDGTPIVPGDIAILLRDQKNTAHKYEKALRAYHIPTQNNVQEDFFANPEVLLMLSFLHIINNPLRDIHLAAVLKSPLYQFTLEELVQIRAACPQGSLYEALGAYCEKNTFAKGSKFLSALTPYRVLSEELPVDRLVWQIYCDTGILSMTEIASTAASDADEQNVPHRSRRRANLMMFYEYARNYTKNAYRGLYSFITYLTGVIDNQTKLKTNNEAVSDNAVQILTIHKSKGLEFPVCFVSNLGKPNQSSEQKAQRFHRTYGIVTKIPEIKKGVAHQPPSFLAMKEIQCEESLYEDVRLLYVAITRAREQLYLTGEQKTSLSTFLDQSRLNGDLPYSYFLDKSFLQLLLHAGVTSNGAFSTLYLHSSKGNVQVPIDEHFDANVAAAYARLDAAIREEKEAEQALLALRQSVVDDQVHQDAEQEEEEQKKEEQQLFEEQINREYQLLSSRLQAVYPHRAATMVPAKLSVSKLYPGILDDELEPLSYTLTPAPLPQLQSDQTHITLPLFMDPQLMSGGALRGTATHAFMQFCDFDRVEKDGIEAEIEYLEAQGFLSQENAARIRRDWLTTFFHTELYREMRQAVHLWREKRFTAQFPARALTQDDQLRQSLGEEEILVQGVIDCFWENTAGEITVLDYKTDMFTKEQCANPDDVRHALEKRHLTQLQYYRSAAQRMTCKPVKHVLLYAFSANMCIDLIDRCL